eukprot:1157298-Pelagomonas_calceolata.AAC.11
MPLIKHPRLTSTKFVSVRSSIPATGSTAQKAMTWLSERRSGWLMAHVRAPLALQGRMHSCGSMGVGACAGTDSSAGKNAFMWIDGCWLCADTSSSAGKNAFM